ncbi:MAG: hypothetical protein R2741_09165 [Methanolobus sp.]
MSGHFGHIDLVAPVIHVGFNKTIRKTLRSVCRNCSRLLLEPEKKRDFLEQLETSKEMGHLLTISSMVFKEARKSKACPYCSTEQLEIKFEKPSDYVEDGHKLTPTESPVTTLRIFLMRT